MPHTTEHDRLRAEAIQALRRAQLCLRKLSTDGTDVTDARATVRAASNIISRIPRTPLGIHSVDSVPGRFNPLSETHPAVGHICPGCGQRLEPGDVPAFVNAAVTDDPYIAQVRIAHEGCIPEQLKEAVL